MHVSLRQESDADSNMHSHFQTHSPEARGALDSSKNDADHDEVDAVVCQPAHDHDD